MEIIGRHPTDDSEWANFNSTESTNYHDHLDQSRRLVLSTSQRQRRRLRKPHTVSMLSNIGFLHR
jgi:hypothetical protein